MSTFAAALCLVAASAPGLLLPTNFGPSPAADQETPAPQAPAQEAPKSAPLVPGELPADTAPDVRELWQRFRANQRAPGAAEGPLRTFDVEFKLRLRRANQSNDLEARVLYEAAGRLVRFSPVGQPEVGRSKKGFWLKDGEEVRWLAGREYATDRAQVEEALAVASAFTRLSDPSRLRIASLALLRRGPMGLPSGEGTPRVRDLIWLELLSPDFELGARQQVGPSTGPTLDRVRIGLEAGTLVPRIVEVSPLVPPPPPPPALDPAAEPVQGPVLQTIYLLEESKPLSGLRVPHRMFIFERRATDSRAPGLPEAPTGEVYLQRGALNVDLAAERFEP